MSQDADFYFFKIKNHEKEKIADMENVKKAEVLGKNIYFIQGDNENIATLYLDSEIHITFTERCIQEYYKIIINEIKKIYSISKVGGFGVNEYDGDREEYDEYPFGTSRKDISRVWSVNLFPPSEVQKYGREKLLKAPCELIEEWEDEAIFMMIHKDRFSSTYEERKKLREYLKVEKK